MASIVNRILYGRGTSEGDRDKTSDQSANKDLTQECSEEKDNNEIPDKPYILNSLFYLFVILFIGTPMWFYTCSVTRYSLPDLQELEDRLLNSKESLPRLHLDVSVIQLSKDQQITNYLRQKLTSNLNTAVENITYDIDWRIRRPIDQEIHILSAHVQNFEKNGKLDDSLYELENQLVRVMKLPQKFRLHMYLIDEPDYTAFCDPMKPHTYTIGFERFAFLCPSMALANQNDFSSIVTLIHGVLEDVYSKSVDFRRVKAMMRTKKDLLISLLPENGIHNLERLTEISGLIHDIHEKSVKSTFPELKELTDIRVITQYIFDLLEDSLIGQILTSSQIKDDNNNGTESTHPRILKMGQLHKLFHKFESRISKHSSQNVHNVLFVVPNPKRPPIIHEATVDSLNILEGQDSSTMIIHNNRKSLVLNLRALFRRVSGLSSPNICEHCLIRRGVFFNRWEMDAIMGALTVYKLQSTLTSLRSIKPQVVGVKIPKQVSFKVRESLQKALDAIYLLERKDPLESYRSASKSYELSEVAYYDPSLLESLYFPEEYKYAIYLPLFLPLALPFILSLVRISKAFMRSFTTCGKITKLKIN